MRKILSVFLLVTVLIGCANPHIVKPVSGQERSMSCDALRTDIAKTELYKQQAREEDGFRWKYIFVVNAVTSWMRMNKAEKAADNRLKNLEMIYESKGCGKPQEPAMAPIAEPMAE